MFSYAIAVILYNPDKDAVHRTLDYAKSFDQVLALDNSEKINSEIINPIICDNKIIYHSMAGNKGMSGALNYAFRWAIDNRIDFLLTMDQDTNYSIQNIMYMEQCIEASKGKYAIYSANYAKIYMKKELPVSGSLNINPALNKIVKFSMTSGSWMNVEFLPKIIPLENWFIGFVDYNVCASLIENYDNAKIIRIGNSIMYQQVGGAVADTFFNRFFHVVNLSDVRYYYMLRNIELFLKKFSNNSQLKRLAIRQRIRIMVNVLFEKDKKKKIHFMKLGISDGKKGITGKLNQREYR